MSEQIDSAKAAWRKLLSAIDSFTLPDKGYAPSPEVIAFCAGRSPMETLIVEGGRRGVCVRIESPAQTGAAAFVWVSMSLRSGKALLTPGIDISHWSVSAGTDVAEACCVFLHHLMTLPLVVGQESAQLMQVARDAVDLAREQLRARGIVC